MSFSKKSERKITEQVRYVARKSRNTVESQRRYPQGQSAGILVAVVKTTIGPRSGSTAGQGTVTLKYKNAAGVYVSGEDNVKVDNPYAVTLPVGRWLTVGFTGYWTVIGSDCPV